MTNPSIPLENQEQSESNNKIKKVDNLLYYKELSKRCARRKLGGDNYSESVKNLDFFEECTIKGYENYNVEDFFNDLTYGLEGDNLEKITKLSDEVKKELFEECFKREINKIGVPFDRKRDSLNDIIGKKYTVNQAGKLNLDQAIKKLDSETLDKYIFYPEELEIFVKSILKTFEGKTNSLKEVKKIFETFSFKSASEFQTVIEEKISQNPDLGTKEEVITSLYGILNTIKLGEKIDSIDIRNLFNYGVFNDAQKKEFLKVFLPVISLQELVDSPLKIINKEEASETKTKELTNYLKKKRNTNSIEEDDTELKNLIEDLDLKDIFVSTQKYIDSHIIKLEKSELFAKNVSSLVNKTVEEIKDKINSEIQTPEILQKRIVEDSTLMRKLVGGRKDLEKLKNGVIFRFKLLKEDNSQFYEVTDFADNGNFSLKNRSLDGKYNSSSDVSTESKNYKELYDLLSSDKLKEFELITKEEIKSKIESGNIEEIKDELGEPGKLELSNYSKKIDEKIEKIKLGKSDEDYKKDEEYIRLMEIKERLSKEDALSDNIVKEELNQFTLESKIDEKDPSGKEFGVKVGVSFKFTEGDDKEYRVYTISHIDQLGKKIEIINPIGLVEPMTFDEFYKGFSKTKVKRFTSNSLLTGLIGNLTKDTKISADWSNFEVKDGNIMKKKQENVTYPYLVQKQKELGKQNKFIKIFDTVGAGANQRIGVSFGEIKGSEKEGDEIYEMSNKKEYVTIGFLENYIKTLELKPKTDQKETLKEDETVIKEGKKPRWGFFKWYLSNKSVFEIISGLKMGFDQFKNHLKSGNEEHSAKVALATWGKFLPTEVKTELKSRVESAEKKHMDDAVGRLKAVDTPDAIDLIYRRLNFKNTEEYKKEAALIFMLEKYGNLYNKNYDGKNGITAPLNSRKGEFLWFKSLSGYRGDVTKHPLYIETKKSCETPDKDGRTRNFTEEELVWMLMKKQCGLHGYNGVHRRSRLHKEVEKLKKEGLKTEIEDGYKKGNDTRNPSDQLRKGIGEIKDGSPANGIGRFKKLVDRGDDMTTMNTIPMVLIYSGVANTLPDDLCDAVKGMIDEGRVIPIARFMSYPGDIKLAMKTIKILANKIQEKFPNYNTIGKDANELYEDFVTGRISERERVEKTLKFFQDKKGKTGKTYGQILTRAMYMSADGEYDDEDSEINSLLLTEKDKPGEDGEILTNYFKKQHAYIGNMSIKDGYFSDSFLGRGLSSVGVKVISETLKAHSGGAFNMPDSGAGMVEEIKNEIEATKKRKYKNEEDRRTWLNYYLRNFFAGLVESAQTKPDGINSLFKGIGSFRFFADNRGITFDKVIKAELSKDDILEGNKGDKLFNRFISNIIENKGGGNVSDNIFSIIDNKKEEE